VNSFLWLRRGKDTLAFANITGAMVFQGTLLPALGILLTPWARARRWWAAWLQRSRRACSRLLMLRRGVSAPAVPHAV